VQLAALALPADPAALVVAPLAAPQDEPEPRARGTALVPLVQPMDCRHGGRTDELIGRHPLGRRVGEITQQGEVELAARARKIVRLQSFDVRGDFLGAGEEDRHHEEGT
jgi:hypothetical protein